MQSRGLHRVCPRCQLMIERQENSQQVVEEKSQTPQTESAAEERCLSWMINTHGADTPRKRPSAKQGAGDSENQQFQLLLGIWGFKCLWRVSLL